VLPVSAARPAVTDQATNATPAAPSVEDESPMPTDRPRSVTPADVIDTVRLDRSPGYNVSGDYWAIAVTVKGDDVFLGAVRRLTKAERGSGRWTARSGASFTTVPGGPWGTREKALNHLLLHHDLAHRKARRQRHSR
jgi:hypothetical protein